MLTLDKVNTIDSEAGPDFFFPKKETEQRQEGDSQALPTASFASVDRVEKEEEPHALPVRQQRARSWSAATQQATACEEGHQRAAWCVGAEMGSNGGDGGARSVMSPGRATKVDTVAPANALRTLIPQPRGHTVDPFLRLEPSTNFPKSQSLGGAWLRC